MPGAIPNIRAASAALSRRSVCGVVRRVVLILLLCAASILRVVGVPDWVLLLVVIRISMRGQGAPAVKSLIRAGFDRFGGSRISDWIALALPLGPKPNRRRITSCSRLELLGPPGRAKLDRLQPVRPPMCGWRPLGVDRHTCRA